MVQKKTANNYSWFYNIYIVYNSYIVNFTKTFWSECILQEFQTICESRNVQRSSAFTAVCQPPNAFSDGARLDWLGVGSGCSTDRLNYVSNQSAANYKLGWVLSPRFCVVRSVSRWARGPVVVNSVSLSVLIMMWHEMKQNIRMYVWSSRRSFQQLWKSKLPSDRKYAWLSWVYQNVNMREFTSLQ